MEWKRYFVRLLERDKEKRRENTERKNEEDREEELEQEEIDRQIRKLKKKAAGVDGI